MLKVLLSPLQSPPSSGLGEQLVKVAVVSALGQAFPDPIAKNSMGLRLKAHFHS